MEIFANFRDINTDPYLLFIKEKYKGKPITFWYDKIPSSAEELSRNPYNFLFLHEPNEFFSLHNYASQIYLEFSAILTWNDELLNKLSNTVNFTYSGQTLDNDYINLLGEKEFNVSFLCGTKTLVEGHKLRHSVHSLESEIQIPKKWFYVLDDYDHKTDTRPGYTEYSKDLSHIPEGVDPISYGRRVLFNDSMFTVVIENVKYNNWYNKIGDAFVTKTVPLYWGCPNISEFGYDERGIIRFNTKEELLDIINNLTPEKYNEMLLFIEYNYELALQDTFENNISQFFDSFFELNNL
jgi:hypothetical protein|tara:strand:+ start:1915 stop:2799 length:885 start_codon:yes stop_codon:yes gene_type:complete